MPTVVRDGQIVDDEPSPKSLAPFRVVHVVRVVVQPAITSFRSQLVTPTEPRTAILTEGSIPQDGSLVEVRGQRWVVSDSSPGSDGSTLLTLQSVEDGRYGESLPVIWEVEPGRRILPAGSLPEVTPTGFDPPERLAAFPDAVGWSAVTSADVKTLQAPLRSGVTVEEYQLEPAARAIEPPGELAASRRRSSRCPGCAAPRPSGCCTR